MCLNDSMSESVFIGCDQAVANAKNLVGKSMNFLFGCEAQNLVNRHLILLHDAQSVPIEDSVSKDTRVKSTYDEVEGSESDDVIFTHSEEEPKREPEPDTHNGLGSGSESDLSKVEDSTHRWKKSEPLGPLQMELKGSKKPNTQ